MSVLSIRRLLRSAPLLENDEVCDSDKWGMWQDANQPDRQSDGGHWKLRAWSIAPVAKNGSQLMG